jgi:hypothetical protein
MIINLSAMDNKNFKTICLITKEIQPKFVAEMQFASVCLIAACNLKDLHPIYHMFDAKTTPSTHN